MPPYPCLMDRIAHLLGADEDWERPAATPAQRNADLWLAFAAYLLAGLSIELTRSLGAFDGASSGTEILTQHLWAASAAVLLAWRRSHPLIVATLANLHLYVVGTVEPMVAGTLVLQALYFFAVFSGVAWTRDRRALAYVLLGFVVARLRWLAWLFALSSGLEDIYRNLEVNPTEPHGLFPAPVAAVGWVSLNNLLFLGGAVLLGQVAWRGARHTARERAYAETIRTQAARLRDQAVVAERLRIARELHDVVAHHVSVMGVQAAAARRVLDKDPEAVREALGAVEESSRNAVGQMRELLGTLRSDEMDTTAGEGRAPQPDLSDLPVLVEQATSPTREVSYSLVEERPGAAGEVPAPLQLTAYRIAQESLVNVSRHSTATHVSVVVRVADSLEVEVVDNGTPRPGSSGTGLGQRGMRERAELLGGECEIGRREHGTGYRVRVTLPLTVAAGHWPSGSDPAGLLR